MKLKKTLISALPLFLGLISLGAVCYLLYTDLNDLPTQDRSVNLSARNAGEPTCYSQCQSQPSAQQQDCWMACLKRKDEERARSATPAPQEVSNRVEAKKPAAARVSAKKPVSRISWLNAKPTARVAATKKPVSRISWLNAKPTARVAATKKPVLRISWLENHAKARVASAARVAEARKAALARIAANKKTVSTPVVNRISWLNKKPTTTRRAVVAKKPVSRISWLNTKPTTRVAAAKKPTLAERRAAFEKRVAAKKAETQRMTKQVKTQTRRVARARNHRN